MDCMKAEEKAFPQTDTYKYTHAQSHHASTGSCCIGSSSCIFKMRIYIARVLLSQDVRGTSGALRVHVSDEGNSIRHCYNSPLN